MNAAEKLIAENPEIVTTDFFRRFWSSVTMDSGTECWLWTDYKSKAGYGLIRLNNILLYAHRVSFLINVGVIPEGLCVLHHCDIRDCVFPDHLYAGTRIDNARDMHARQRHAVGDQVSNPGESHPMHKLTNAQIYEIRERYASGGITMRSLGVLYGVTSTQVCNIIHRKHWSHLPDHPTE